MKAYLISFSLLIALSACNHHQPEQKMAMANVALPPPAPKADMERVTSDNLTADDKAKTSADENAGDIDNQIVDTAKKIIKNGFISFETNDIAATRKKILSSLKKYGGYVDEDNQTTNNSDNRKEYNLKIRVPPQYFDFVLDSVSGEADKIDSKNISITDVTTQFIDIKTRLANKHTLENRYLELLKKGTKISDLLEIENKLTEIRSDIESTQGQLNYLSKQVSYSSLDITFYTQHIEKADKGTGPGYKLKTALIDGWDILQSLFFGMISLWPIVIISLVFLWLFKRWRRKKALTA